jgi:hypothetical protein
MAFTASNQNQALITVTTGPGGLAAGNATLLLAETIGSNILFLGAEL